MTSREKIGQLFMVGFIGTTVTPELVSFIKDYKPGGVILFPATWNRSSRSSN